MTVENIITLIVGVASPVCTLIITVIKMREILKNNLRTNISLTYYVYKDKKRIPIEVYSGMCSMYDQYVGLNGNSFIKSYKAEMDTWEKE